ncbi:hypothetical protein PFZ55_44750 [Streptomyces sp. MS2A]|nr:hypothetical protein [Streptomyces sp. MS2A]
METFLGEGWRACALIRDRRGDASPVLSSRVRCRDDTTQTTAQPRLLRA